MPTYGGVVAASTAIFFIIFDVIAIVLGKELGWGGALLFLCTLFVKWQMATDYD